jgi:membrane fusion protein, heavy metal efflux system
MDIRMNQTEDKHPGVGRPASRLPAVFFKASVLCIVSLVAGCSAPSAAENKTAVQPPAKVENPVREVDLAAVKLSPQAEQRLGITLATVEKRMVAQTREYSGEVALPTDSVIIVSAPMGGTLSAPATGGAPSAGMVVQKGQPLMRISPFLTPERGLRTQLQRDVATATERVNAAKVRVDRATQLVEERAGSVKNAEQMKEDLAVAENELKAARERLEIYDRGPLDSALIVDITAPISGVIQRINAAPGQATTSGAPLFELSNLSTVWIRVPVYVGEIQEIARNVAARVHGLTDEPGQRVRSAAPIKAPASANAMASTADLYYQLTNTDGLLQPGQRVGVTLTLRGAVEGLTVPWSAVVHDVHGGAWVYENPSAQTFVRKPIEVRHVSGIYAVLARGPAPGTKIVAEGVAELFGVEFGAGK